MFFSNEATVGILIHWALLGLVIAYLPAIIQSAKLNDKIDSHMTSVIRAVIIAYLIMNIVGVASSFVARFFS